jgi:hypothetical protein
MAKKATYDLELPDEDMEGIIIDAAQPKLVRQSRTQ